MKKILGSFVKDFYRYSRRKFVVNILLMIVMGLSGGISILLLIPLLSLAGIAVGSEGLIGTFGVSFQGLPDNLRLPAVLIIYLLVILIHSLLTRKLSILNAELVQGYTRHLRVTLYQAFSQATWACLLEKKKSDLTNAFTVELTRVGSGALFFLRLISQTVVAVIQIVIAFWLSAPVTLLVLASGAILFLYLNSTVKESKRLGVSLHAINRELIAQITENLNAIKEVKSYGIEDQQIIRFAQTNQSIEQNIISFTRLQTRPELYFKIGAAVIISIFFYTAVRFLAIEPAAMLVIMFIFARLWPVFSSLQSGIQNIFVMLPAFVAVKKHENEFGLAAEKPRAGDDTPLIRVEAVPRVEFCEVGFQYQPGSPSFALQEISFTIPPKSVTALAGHSGAGKSTIADILLGLLIPTCGNIRVDGTILDEDMIKEWRKLIGYVPQDPFLYNDTIRQNLVRFNPGVGEGEILQALEMASAREFVERLPQGLETSIGDRGVKLSGGERQRIVLARALLKKPKILVLDEATSALDQDNEYRIQQAVESLRHHMTVVIIAHRPSTIQTADQIIVLEQGKINAIGPTPDLATAGDGSPTVANQRKEG